MTMKIALDKFDLVIKYEDGEWERLAALHRDLGLEEATSTQAWGDGYTVRFFRDRESRFINHFRKTAMYVPGVYDDINAPAIGNGQLNLAIFRVIPENGQVRVPLGQVMTVVEWRNLLQVIARVLKSIFETVILAEAEIRVTTAGDNAS
jgi:hypothetical protein